MRFQLTLSVKRGSMLPLNYQYPLSSWIYKCINQSDGKFASYLHEKGYPGNKAGKPFKFFTFSKIQVSQKDIYQDRMVVLSNEIKLIVSFLIEGTAEHFIRGAFQNQHVGIGDQKSQMDFEIVRIEVKPAAINETVHVRTISPIVISQPVLKNSKMQAKFLAPTDAGYQEYFFNNLIRKYESYANYTGIALTPTFQNDMKFELHKDKVLSRLIMIKSGTAAQTQIRGFDYSFSLTAPYELVRIGMLAGFGEKNSLGFGCGEVVL